MGSVAATTALNSLFIGASFELGQEAGNIAGALLDTLVDDLQGGPEIDSSLSKSLNFLGFGSGQPNAPKSAIGV